MITVADVHRAALRWDGARASHYEALAGAAGRIIARAVSVDPRRTSVRMSMQMLIRTDIALSHLDAEVAVQYVQTALRRGGFTVEYTGGGWLVVSWPAPTPTAPDVSAAVRDVQERRASVATAEPTYIRVEVPMPPHPATSRGRGRFDSVHRTMVHYRQGVNGSRG